MNKLLSEVIEVFPAIPAGDPDAPITTDVYYEMSEARKILVYAAVSDLNDADDFQLQLLQATAADGTGSTDLGDPITVLGPAGDGFAEIQTEVVPQDMDIEDGFRFLGATIVSDNTEEAFCVFIVGDRRYNP